MNKQKLTVAIYLLIIFFIGIGAGVTLSHYCFQPRRHMKWSEKFINEIRNEFNLNNEQTVKIESIVSVKSEEFKNLRNNFKKEFAEINKRLRSEIEKELT